MSVLPLSFLAILLFNYTLNYLPKYRSGFWANISRDDLHNSLFNLNRPGYHNLLLLTTLTLANYVYLTRYASLKVLWLIVFITSLHHIDDHILSTYWIKSCESYLDDKLINGVLAVHPLLLLSSYALLVLALISLYSSYNFTVFNSVTLSNADYKARLYLSLTFLIFAIFLGSFWSYQEVNWGGFWSWDIIEVFSLLSLSIVAILSHAPSKLTGLLYPRLIYLLIFLLTVLFARYDLVSSIHGFLSSQPYSQRSNYSFFSVLLIISLTSLNFAKSNFLRHSFYKFGSLYLLLVWFIIILAYTSSLVVVSVTSLNTLSITNFTIITLLILPFLLAHFSSVSFVQVIYPIIDSAALSVIFANSLKPAALNSIHILFLVLFTSLALVSGYSLLYDIDLVYLSAAHCKFSTVSVVNCSVEELTCYNNTAELGMSNQVLRPLHKPGNSDRLLVDFIDGTHLAVANSKAVVLYPSNNLTKVNYDYVAITVFLIYLLRSSLTTRFCIKSF